jgi:5-methyltetrahydrofolate--homocysteine methyltransferase
MDTNRFIAVGENIHCTRIYKVGGKFVKTLDDGTSVITYTVDGQTQHLPIPAHFVESEDWTKGKKVKHTAVAIWQGVYGDEAGKEVGISYLHNMVRVQEANGAAFLDVDVDEFSTDVEERMRLIQWTAETIQQVSSIPLSIDSSNIDILRAGLKACDPAKGKPMLNSLSLERIEAIDVAREFNAVVIAGATGETSMPSNVEERLQNYDKLMPMLKDAGIATADIYLDPLIFPASVNAQNSKDAIDAIKALREKYGSEVHFAPGLSNVSYGLPNRKLLNLVFAYLCRQNGCDGGIVDPRHINTKVLQNVDTGSKGFELAKAFLEGQDEFGMNYIRAVRKGEIS